MLSLRGFPNACETYMTDEDCEGKNWKAAGRPDRRRYSWPFMHHHRGTGSSNLFSYHTYGNSTFPHVQL